MNVSVCAAILDRAINKQDDILKAATVLYRDEALYGVEVNCDKIVCKKPLGVCSTKSYRILDLLSRHCAGTTP